jgi:SNF2 family DNA or RNA helicase
VSDILHSFCYDSYKNLELKYKKSDDSQIEFNNQDWLNEAGYEKRVDSFIYSRTHSSVNFRKVIKWTIEKFGESLDICPKLENEVEQGENLQDQYESARENGIRVKSKQEHDIELPSTFLRELRPFQKESVEHILALGNAANFSVPGGGKTTITYAAISRWLKDGVIKKILVIGPTAAFVPWEEEFQACFGRPAKKIRLRGNLASELPRLSDAYELFLMHFSTAMNKVFEIREFLQKHKTVLIIDESHNIKNPHLKRWARAALEVAGDATKRIILSGTPMPNDARDLWTQITFLWPDVDNASPLGPQLQFNDRIKRTGGLPEKYREILDPLYCRITKKDLGLPEPKFENYIVDLMPVQRKIYDVIAAKTLEEIKNFREQSRLQKFRTAKMTRLLMVASNPTLLKEYSDTFDVDGEQFGLFAESIEASPISELSVYDAIVNYSKNEIPFKMVEAGKIAHELLKKGEKVLIWSSFKHNMKVFKKEIFPKDNPILINGDVPKDPPKDYQGTSSPRDDLIQEFKNDPNPRVLIATPASLAEAVSLHKNILDERVCSHAIYLDRNYNGAQFMQSMDRIHRIGMIHGEGIPDVTYHLIRAKNTIDEKIHDRLWDKNRQMHNVLKSKDLQTLDYDGSVIDPGGEEFQKDYDSLVSHLKELHRQQ